MKNRLLNGEMIELSNQQDLVMLWFQKKTNNFCLMLNSKVIKATKTWNPINEKLKKFDNLEESKI